MAGANINYNPMVVDRLRANGYVASTVERYDSFTRRSHDLFGFIDVLGVGGGETLAVQVTSRDNMAKRRRKIREAPELPYLLLAGWHVELWGFDQPNGPGTRYRLLVEDIDQ